MTFLALRILLAGWAKSAWALLSRYPWQGALILALCWGAWERHTAHKWEARAVACQTASDTARKAQEALRAQERARYQEQARHADEQHSQAITAARDATDRYIAAHRVRPARHISPAEPVSEAGPASVPESVPAEAIVAVSEQDVRTCGDLYAYALNAHEWAMTITGN